MYSKDKTIIAAANIFAAAIKIKKYLRIYLTSIINFGKISFVITFSMGYYVITSF